jgi:hypothetical protein
MSIQGWIPDLQFLVPSWLSAERIRDGAVAVAQGALFVAGVVNGIFAVQHVAKNERLPAASSAGTSMACFFGYRAIEGLKPFRTLEAQLTTLDQLNQRIAERTEELDTLAGVYANNSTSLTDLVDRINVSVNNLETLSRDQQLPAVTDLINTAKNLLHQVQDLSSDIKKTVLVDVMQTLNQVKEELIRTSQNNERERDALTEKREQLQREQMKFAVLATAAIAIAKHPEILQKLTVSDRALVDNFWATHTGIPLNQQNQPA